MNLDGRKVLGHAARAACGSRVLRRLQLQAILVSAMQAKLVLEPVSERACMRFPKCLPIKVGLFRYLRALGRPAPPARVEVAEKALSNPFHVLGAISWLHALSSPAAGYCHQPYCCMELDHPDTLCSK